MERELEYNNMMMQQKVQSLVDERQFVERLIVSSTITIQRFARGFITRLKLKKFQNLQMELERAKLDDALNEMQALISQQAKYAPPTPAKEVTPSPG